MRNRAMAKKHDKQTAQFRAWRQWRRDRAEALLDGPYGAAATELLDLLSRAASGAEVIAAVEGGSWCGADSNTRAEQLALAAAAIVKVREQAGLVPFDDPLPGEPDNLFLKLRSLLSDEAPEGAADRGAARLEPNLNPQCMEHAS